MKNALAKKNSDEVKKLDPIIRGYHGILTDLLKMTATEGVSTKHLALINTMGAMVRDIESMRAVFTDPVLGINGAKSYAKTSFDFYWAFKGLADYFAAHGVVFGANESGRGFTNVI